MNRRLKVRKFRIGVQIFFFLLILLISIGHTLEESGVTISFIQGASLHAVCPFGGVVSIYQYIASGTFVKKIHDSSFILMILVFLSAILFGPLFCGWICPFGSIQEWFGKIGKVIFKKRYNRFIPAKFDKVLRYLRYGILAWVIIVTAYSTKLIFAEYDPYNALFNFWTSEVAVGGLVSLAAVLILSLFVERPFCKYACPYGAVLGLSNLFKIFSIHRNGNTCIDCSLCDKACPMNIEVSGEKSVRNHQCISCYECTSEAACPVPATVEIATWIPKNSSGSVQEVSNEN